MSLSKDGPPEERMSLGFKKVFKEEMGPAGKIIYVYDPDATLDQALEDMSRDLRPPTDELLNFLINN